MSYLSRLFKTPLRLRQIHIEADLLAEFLCDEMDILPLGAQFHRRNQENRATLHHALKVYIKDMQRQLSLLLEKGHLLSDHDRQVVEFYRAQIVRAKRLDRLQEVEIINTKLVKWKLS